MQLLPILLCISREACDVSFVARAKNLLTGSSGSRSHAHTRNKREMLNASARAQSYNGEALQG